MHHYYDDRLTTGLQSLPGNYPDLHYSQQAKISRLIWFFDQRPDHITGVGKKIYCRQFQKTYGPQYLNVLVGSGALEIVGDYDKGSHTRAYTLTDAAIAIRAQYLDNAPYGQPGRHRTDTGRVLRTVPTSIAPPAKRGRNTTTPDGPATLVPIDRDRLQQFLDNCTDPTECLAAGRCLAESNMELTGGSLMHRYTPCSTGRLFAGGCSLQSCPRALRPVCLPGAHNYDIANCHVVLYRQLCARHGIDTPSLADYTARKRYIRQTVAADCGITTADCKTALLQLLYGAGLIIGGSLEQTIGRAAFERFKAHDYVKRIARELCSTRPRLIAAQPVSRRTIGNLAGYSIKASAKQGEIIAHLLQGAERVILDVVLDHCSDDLLVLVHDGWISRASLDIEALVSEVERSTGFQIEIEHEQFA